ncbi:hypothetical protein GCM10009712_02970 [Pseudarthrobacter sulfonivorans]|uniref:hypothetical protein n=1 Tax=Pseudarthrobacter sulfonivorans TaxID=121292 RepID=UPI00168B4565|nr:hypothetical protein [Pseudarthrobacter sulfonivorans]
MTLLRIHAEPEDAAVNPSEVAALVAATEPVQVRLDEVHAGPVQSAAADMTVKLVRGEPGFAYDPEANVLLVRLEHVLSCFAGQGEDNATIIRANHIVAFSVIGELDVSAATVSAWIETNVYFIAYPYIRQFFTQLTSALGLPPVVLGYMKRDEWPFADATSESTVSAEEPVNVN